MITVLDNVLDPLELRKICDELASAMFVDGSITAGKSAKRVKNNEQLGSSETGVRGTIRDALFRHPQFKTTAFPKKVRPFLISRYHAGMAYGTHVDNALMGKDWAHRSDISLTLFLNSPTDYTGGELEIDSPYGPQQIKLPAGSAVLYPSSTLHRVCPVEEGERLVAVTWIQSLVKDPAQREVLHDLVTIRRSIQNQGAESYESNLADKTYANLLRMWADC